MKKLILVSIIALAFYACKKNSTPTPSKNTWIIGTWKPYKYLDTVYNPGGTIHYDTAKSGGYTSLVFNNNGSGESNGAYQFTYDLSTNIINLYGTSQLTTIIKLSDTTLELNQHKIGIISAGWYFKKD